MRGRKIYWPRDPKQLLVCVLITLLEQLNLQNIHKHKGRFGCFFKLTFFFFPSFFPSSFLSFLFSFFLFFSLFFPSIFPFFSFPRPFSYLLPVFLAISQFFCFSLSYTCTQRYTQAASPENTTLYFDGRKHQGMSIASKMVLLLQHLIQRCSL